MIKYRTTMWEGIPDPKIMEFQYEKETDKSIWTKDGSVFRKESARHRFHNSWEEAHEYILNLANDRVTFSILRLERATSLLGNIKGLKKEE